MMRIGELARRTGISVRMLRYYEAEGLLRPARTASGYRCFDAADAERARRIVVLNRAGLTLDRIRPLLGCDVAAAPLYPALRATIMRGLTDLDARITDLEASRSVLRDLLASGDQARAARPA